MEHWSYIFVNMLNKQITVVSVLWRSCDPLNLYSLPFSYLYWLAISIFFNWFFILLLYAAVFAFPLSMTWNRTFEFMSSLLNCIGYFCDRFHCLLCHFGVSILQVSVLLDYLLMLATLCMPSLHYSTCTGWMVCFLFSFSSGLLAPTSSTWHLQS